MATFKMGETVVDLKTGQQFRVADGDLELDPSKYGRIEAGAKVEPQDVTQGAEQFTEAEFTKERQRSAMEEPTFKKFARATIPTIAASLSMVPGVGPFMGAGLQMAGTAANQAVGLEDPNLNQILLSGAIPISAGLGMKAVGGGIRAVGKVTAPSATRAAAGEAAIENTGATGNMISRAYEVPGSKAAYAAAEAQAPLPARSFAKEIRSAEQTASKSLQARPARRILRETADTVYPPIKIPEVPAASNMEAFLAGKQKVADEVADAFRKRPSTISWKQAIDHVQELRNSATELYKRDLHIGGKTLTDAAEKLMNKMSSVSPEYAAANKLYNREQSINRVAKIFTKPGPSSKLGLLFQEDKMTKAAFDLEETQMLEKVAKFIDTVGATGSPYSGLGGRAVDFLVTPVASLMRSPFGMWLMKRTFKHGVTPQGIATIGQFMRAYEAQGGE